MKTWLIDLVERPLTARWRHRFIACACLLAMAAAWVWLDRLALEEQTRQRAEQRRQVLLDAERKRIQLEGEIRAVNNLTDGLVAYITAYHDDLNDVRDLDLMLSVLYRHSPHIGSIALAPGNRVSYAYPPAVRPRILGIYFPQLKEQWPSVEQAIRSRRSVLSGPVRLVQGGHGLVQRTPVFLKGGRYWGLLSLVLKHDSLFKTAGLSGAGAVEYALRGADGHGARGRPILGRPELFGDGSVLLDVNIPSGRWQLAARPRADALTAIAVRTVRARTLAGSTALLIGVMLYYLLRTVSERLRERERLELTQFTMDHASEAILWVDDRGRVVYCNEAAASLAPGARERGTLWELVPGIDAHAWRGIWNTLKEEGVRIQELALAAPGGGVTYLESTTSLVAYGRRELAVSFLRDVTRHRIAEDAMRASQRQTELALREANRLALIVNRTRSAVILSDVDGCIEWVNAGFTRMTGYEADEAVGRRPGDFLHGADTDPDTVRQMRRQMRDGEEFRAELLKYTKGGRPFWVDIEVQPLRDENGVLTGFMAIQTDVTERKSTETRLEEAQRIAHIGFWEFHERSRRIIWSDETYRIAGLEIGLSLDGVDPIQRLVHPDDLEDVYRANEAMYRGDARISNEHRIVRPDGSVRYVRLLGQGLRDADGRVVRLFGTLQDITEQKQAEILKNEFISTVSHELRTPLTAMLGALGLLAQQADEGLDPQGRKLLEVTRRNAERLSLLINDLLDMEKITSGRMEFHFERLPLQEQVEAAILATQPYGDRYGVRFCFWNDSPGACLEADRHRLQQVLANLMSNAAKFSSPGNAPLDGGRVEIHLSRHGDRLRISVQDYGMGIPPEKHDRLFQKFAQIDTSDARAKGGTGLGLSICRSLTEQMRGRIGFVSVPGAGSTFWIEFPEAAG